jgi:hypothetical protein
MNRIADRDYEFYDFNDDSDHEPCSRFDNKDVEYRIRTGKISGFL